MILTLEACKEECCNCTAYASADISEGGSGCLMWDGDLIDLRIYSEGGQDMYTRVAASELDGSTIKYSGGLRGKKKLLVTLLTMVIGLLAFILCGYCCWSKAKGCEMNEISETESNDNDIEENDKCPFAAKAGILRRPITETSSKFRDKGPISSAAAADGELGPVGSLHSVSTSVAMVPGEIQGNCGAVFNSNTTGDETFLERIPTLTPSTAPPSIEPAIS
ncbi:hypothetical protein MRB53_021561 [Persea americana]|uniref:Uncharacterized protein n=1 Tax=Persea americana TaxID=3435 RepID=A0ACC2L483_PERAE|nr:hypothetical protein MRB53_021561 [Persea americana]